MEIAVHVHDFSIRVFIVADFTVAKLIFKNITAV